MNPNQQDNFMFWGITLIFFIAVLCAVILNPLHKKNIEKLHKPKPVDRTKIVSTNLTGNVESIHPWGRTEVVPMKEVELEYFQYCDEWVMYGDVVQPIGRKDYFMPVLKGHLDLDVNETTTTWIEYGKYWTGLGDGEESYEDFRVAHIKIKTGSVINIQYTHYRLDQNKSWSIIASWEAKF
jgi:mannose-6-phosphate isomerase-like protein (cupin superfamily)